ncbi:MAG: hypothetical protein WC994_03295 [Brumimicrobium sp.]
MTNKPISREYLNSVSLIYYVLMAGIIMFSGVVYFLLIDQTQGISDENFYNIAIYLVPIMSIGTFIAGKILAKQINQKNKNKSWGERLDGYKTASLIKVATLEGSALFSIVCALLTNQIKFLLFAVILLLIMFWERPSEGNIRKSLG